MGLTVAVTGPTGEIGKSAVRALEREPEVERIIGMARRPFDPSEHGWERTEYRQGDILDRDSVADLVAGADVVVHLAFIIFGSADETHRVNLEGTRNVFDATVAAGAKRLVYTSSVAAYGFPDVDGLITEDVQPRQGHRLYYSAQKAELESVLADALAGSATDAYVLRPCIVAGHDAPVLIEKLVAPLQARGPLKPIGRLLGAIPGLRPVLPDPGTKMQLVHHDDVAAAIVACVAGRGAAGPYNLAADGVLSVADLARAVGWRSVPIPAVTVDAAAEITARLPLMPPEVDWLHALRSPVLMDNSRAKSELGWEPKLDAHQTLAETVAAARESGILGS
jgi:nucleoside-diphosphate-sugar epimerase